MDFEYWWLIVLPLFFTLGWIAARIDIKQLLAESTCLPAAYFKGLNFLMYFYEGVEGVFSLCNRTAYH